MTVKIFFARLAFATAAFAPLQVFSQSQEMINLEWVAMPEAKRYEVEIRSQLDKEKTIVAQSTEMPAISASLSVGFYSYRVRAILEGWVPGPWSEYLDFEVNATAIKILEPANLSEFEITKTKAVKLNWEAASASGRYVVQVSGPSGTKEFETTSPELNWKPTVPGSYTWKAGYKSGSAVVWSNPASLVVKKPAVPEVPVKPLVAKVEPPAAISSDAESFFGKTSVDYKVWMGPVYTIYSGRYVDEQNSTTASTLSEVYGVSVLLKKKSSAETAGLVLGLDASVRRQQMVRSMSALPGGHITLSYHLNHSGWHHSIYTSAGIKKSGLFIIDSSARYSSDTVTRTRLNAGVTSDFQVTPNASMGIGAAAGIESGGSSDLIQGSFKPTPSLEISLFSALKLERVWNLNVTFTNDNLSWSAADGSVSSLNTSMASFTLGTTL